VTWGPISLSSSTHFALMPYSNDVKPVVLPPGRARLATKPAPTGSAMPTNTIGTVRLACCNVPTFGLPVARMTGRERHQFRRVSARKIDIAGAPEAVVNPYIAPFGPAQLL